MTKRVQLVPTVTIHAAKTNLSRLIEQALRGEEVVIARGDMPVVRLVPVDRPPRRAGTLKGKLRVPESFFDSLPEDELARWDGGS
jgi:antitoxin (DNA-binding transcriptional repressor) of toxin-antitoxin stability system